MECIKVKLKEYACTVINRWVDDLNKKDHGRFLVYFNRITVFMYSLCVIGEAQDYTGENTTKPEWSCLIILVIILYGVNI